MEIFKKELSLEQAHDVLVKHIRENSSVSIGGDGKINFFISENGDCSWWFDELVELILEKLSDGDKEIIKICIKKNIDLFDISLKKPINPTT